MRFETHRINPYIRRAKASIIPVGTAGPRRTIFDYELIYLESGDFILNYGDKDYHCKGGEFIFLRPGIPHNFKNIQKDLHQPHIHFDVFYSAFSPQVPVSSKDEKDFTVKERASVQTDVFADYPQNPIVSFKNEAHIKKLFYEIIENRNLASLKSKARLIEIIDALEKENFPNCFIKNSPYSVAEQVKDYIDMGHGIATPLEELERIFAYSRFNLERQFKKLYRVSIISYRNNKRMELAEYLLKNQNVSAVAEALGFSSIYVFSRAFKTHSGLSPTEFKKEVKRENKANA